MHRLRSSRGIIIAASRSIVSFCFDRAAPFNFLNTAGITGGNSGSPVVDREGELAGIIFDGNLQSLVLDYSYTEEQARAIAVHSAGILEALRSVYGANELVAELSAGK
jgi:hypothetical protein